MALEQGASVVMRAHHSNFKIIGFTSEPELTEIINLTHTHDAIFIDDLGSGALLDTTQYGLAHEPMVQESIQCGADLVCFSGDKLLGGPQAGIILGRRDLIARLKKAPLARALRADKLCLSSLSATLMHYLKGEAEQHIPIWQMIAQSNEEIKSRALRLQQRLGRGEIKPGHSTVGGGSLPQETLPTTLFCLKADRPDAFLAQLRRSNPPVIARIEQDEMVIDLRTVLLNQEDVLAAVLIELFA